MNNRRFQFSLAIALASFLGLGIVFAFVGSGIRQRSIALDLVRGGGSYEVDRWGNVIELELFNVGDRTIKQLAELPKLTKLQIKNSSVQDFCFLNRLPVLEDLTLDDSIARENQNLNLKIKNLSLVGESIELLGWLDEDSCFKSLTIVNRYPEQTIDASLISRFPSLISLAIVGCEIKNAQSLANLAKLKKLSLYSSSFRGEIQFVEKLTGLEFLELTGVTIEDYSSFRKAKSLKKLCLDRYSFSEDDAEIIRSWLPNCRVVLV